jgi:hypothetical protein
MRELTANELPAVSGGVSHSVTFYGVPTFDAGRLDDAFWRNVVTGATTGAITGVVAAGPTGAAIGTITGALIGGLTWAFDVSYSQQGYYGGTPKITIEEVPSGSGSDGLC